MPRRQTHTEKMIFRKLVKRITPWFSVTELASRFLAGARQWRSFPARERWLILRPLIVAIFLIAAAVVSGAVPSPKVDALATFYDPDPNARGVKFVDRAAEWGVRHLVFPPVADGRSDFEVARGVATVVIEDLNNDGWMDLIFSAGRNQVAVHVYLNLQGRGFSKFEHPSFVNEFRTSSYLPNRRRRVRGYATGISVFDVDGDGHKDIVESSLRGCVRVLFNRNMNFEVGEADRYGGKTCGIFLSSNFGDLDGDGRLDLLVHPQSNRSVKIDEAYRTNRVLLNKPEGLIEATAQIFPPNSDYTWGSLLTYYRPLNQSAEGKSRRGPDLYLINDFRRPRFYRWTQKGYKDTFGRVVPGFLVHGQMGGDTADLYGENETWYYVSNITRPGSYQGYNYLFRPPQDGIKMQDVARELGVDRCGFGWGAKFIDVNNDGRKDLVVTNGISRGLPGVTRESWFLYMHALSIPDFIYDINGTKHFAAMRIPGNISGFERNCLFLQNEDGKFTDIGPAAGIADDNNGRGVAIGDLNNDGRLDVVIANANAPPHIYMNETKTEGGWVGLRVVRPHGKSPVGLLATLRTDTNMYRHEHFPGNGYAGQNEDRIHFAFGQQQVRELKLRLPYGAKEYVFKADSLKLNQYQDLVIDE